MINIAKSTAFVAVFKAFLASDHTTEATGKTIAMTISKAGGAFGNLAAGATNATEISSGWYKVALGTGDVDTVGILAIRGAVATIDDVGVWYNVVNATNGGLTALPDTAVTTNASLLTSGTGTAQITNASGLVSVGTLAAGVITAASIASDAITDAKVASDVTIASVTGAVGSVTGAVGSVTGAVGSVAAGGIAAASFAAGAVNAAALAADAGAEIADAVLDRDMSTGADSGSTTVRTARQALRFLRNKWAISAGTLTVYKEDDSTSSWTSAVTTSASADPVISNDPAGP